MHQLTRSIRYFGFDRIYLPKAILRHNHNLKVEQELLGKLGGIISILNYTLNKVTKTDAPRDSNFKYFARTYDEYKILILKLNNLWKTPVNQDPVDSIVFERIISKLNNLWKTPVNQDPVDSIVFEHITIPSAFHF